MPVRVYLRVDIPEIASINLPLTCVRFTFPEAYVPPLRPPIAGVHVDHLHEVLGAVWLLPRIVG